MSTFSIVAVAYLIGSVPFALLVSRRRGIDLRTVGSGNVGAANVLRTSGVPVAVLTMLLDGLKGALAVVIAQRVAQNPDIAVTAALASILGHVYPVWLRFQGGKGVATAAGAFTPLAPLALAVASAMFVLAVAITRFISVGSIVAAITLVAMTAATRAPAAVVSGATLAAAIVVYRHRGNLARLAAGTERRVDRRTQLSSYGQGQRMAMRRDGGA